MAEVTTTVPAAEPLPLYERCDCLRCGHSWRARNPQTRPSSCPRCGSGRWDVPPQRKSARRPDDPPNPNWQYRLKPIKVKCPTCHRPMRRLTVAERKEQEERARQAEAVAIDQPARPSAVNAQLPITDRAREAYEAVVGRRMTPPPGLRRPTPPPLQPAQAETPEVQVSRNTTQSVSSLSEELKEKS